MSGSRRTSIHDALSVELALLASLAVLVTLAGYYFPFFSDDALISLRYAERLTEGQGLTWDDFEKVEGYTDLLWILLCALPMKLGLDGMWTARVWDMIGAASAVVLVSLGPVRLRPVASRAWFGGLFLGSLAPLAVWAIGGLEHGFMAGVIIVSLLLIDRARHRPVRARSRALLLAGVPLAALALLRADGAVLVFGLGMGLLVSSPFSSFRLALRSVYDLLRLVVLPLSAWLGQLAFRVAYYDDWLPNTARAKVAMNSERLAIGWDHVKNGLTPLTAGVVLLLSLIVLTRGRRTYRAVPALSCSLVWLGYLVSVGGDIFPGWRQLLLGIVPLGFALATLGERFALRRPSRALYVPLVVLVLGAQLNMQLPDSENRRAKSERWEWQGLSMGPALRRAFADREPLLAVDAAGALPYWTGFASIDMLGLNDRYLVRHPPPWHGKDGSIGHDLGDPAYVISREPDLIAFCNAAGGPRPCFRASQQLVLLPAFRKDYRSLRFQGTTFSGLGLKRLGARPSIGVLQVRTAGKLGWRRTEKGLEVPGYFLASQASNGLAVPLEDEFVARVTAAQPGLLERVTLPPGRFALKLDADAPLLVSMRCGRVSTAAMPLEPHAAEGSSSRRDGTVIVDGGRTLDLLLAPRGEVAHVRLLSFEKTDERKTLDCRRSRGVQLADLDSRAEGTHWMAPPAVMMGPRGLRVHAQGAELGETIEVVGDNNDRLQLKLSFQDGSTYETIAEVVPEPGMRLRTLPVPPAQRGKKVDQVEITPLEGDASFSVSGLFLSNSGAR